MDKDNFDAGLAQLQAQLDAALRAVNDATKALDNAEIVYGEAKRALSCHITYGKHRGWIERAKRGRSAAATVLEALEQGPATWATLMERTGLAKSSVFNGLSALRKAGHEIDLNDGYYWLVPAPAAPVEEGLQPQAAE